MDVPQSPELIREEAAIILLEVAKLYSTVCLESGFPSAARGIDAAAKTAAYAIRNNDRKWLPKSS